MLALLALSSATNTLLIAILIPTLGVISPLLLARQINHNARDTKKQDWARQDEVAARAQMVAKQAAEAAQLVIERQIVLDDKTNEVARLLKKSTTDVDNQLKKIHGLVNSQFTEAIRSELGATQDTLALMSELIKNNKMNKIQPTEEVLIAFKSRQTKISELQETLRVREEADAQSKLVGPREVVIVNPDPVPVIDITEQDVVIVNPEPVPVTDTQEQKTLVSKKVPAKKRAAKKKGT